ncbi:MAG: hypothetical protein IPM16_23900 [Chloroflexi bacterium]|nr:hypothetical protein [Chloroflexota bacterium]
MLLYFVLGLLIGGAAIYLAHRPGIKIALLDWILLALALVFFWFALVNYSGSMAELEPRAAGVLLLAFGLPGLILAAIAGVRIFRSRGGQQPKPA